MAQIHKPLIQKHKSQPFIQHKSTSTQEWQRVGFGPGFSIPGPDPRGKTHGPDPPRLGYRVFSRGPDPPQQGPTGPAGPFRDWAQFVAQPKKKKKKVQIFFSYVQAQFFFFFHSSLHIPNKKIKPNLFLPTFKPTYLNSSLDNVAQMPNHRLLIINK